MLAEFVPSGGTDFPGAGRDAFLSHDSLPPRGHFCQQLRGETAVRPPLAKDGVSNPRPTPQITR